MLSLVQRLLHLDHKLFLAKRESFLAQESPKNLAAQALL